MGTKWLVFTDLDGTLLDFETYDYSAALPALAFLKEKEIPVIPCTSKTHHEVIRLRKQLGLHDPFIVENGSAIFFEPGTFKKVSPTLQIDGLEVLVLGKTHQEILAFLKTLKQHFSLPVKGFSEMSLAEIAKHTGLSLDDAHWAKQRLFSEPMVYSGTEDLLALPKLAKFVQENGFRLLKGNRFYHLIGACDKGRATQKLHTLYEQEYATSFKTLALGDSKNDAEMLAVVDQPVIIRKKDGNFVHLENLNKVYVSQKPGPEGWAEAIFQFINH